MRIRDWTVGELVQGKPWGHPTHPVFVHFPTALYPTGLVFAVASAITVSSAHSRTAAILVGVGLVGAIPAAVTGLVDWTGMVRGSTKRRAVTRHMLVQVVAQILGAGGLAALTTRLGRPAHIGAIVLLAAAVATMFAGNWLGGMLVYRMAMRVGGDRSPARRRARTPEAVASPRRSGTVSWESSTVAHARTVTPPRTGCGVTSSLRRFRGTVFTATPRNRTARSQHEVQDGTTGSRWAVLRRGRRTA